MPSVTSPNILLVSGIWPPDVGGPASHAPDLAAFLVRRGHRVRAVTSGGPATAQAPFPLRVARRDGSAPVRVARGLAAVAGEVRRADVVYATGLYHRVAAAAAAVRRPCVVKLTQDPAYERAQRWGLFDGTPDQFQAPLADARIRLLKEARNRVVSGASRVIAPSRYLAALIDAWGVARRPAAIVGNPAPPVPALPPREALRRELGLERPTAVFAGRLVALKNLPLVISALRRLPGVDGLIIGDGPERQRIEAAVDGGGSVRLLGALPRDEVLRWLAAADVTVLASDYENHPHAAIESLAMGTPVVATRVGGVPEIVEHERTGVLVGPRDEDALAAALTAALDPARNARMREAIAARPVQVTEEETFARIESLLLEAAGAR